MDFQRWVAAALFLALAPSASPLAAQSATTSLGKPKPVTQYYALRRDVRRCAAPLCGGYWASLLNGAPTICADGNEAEECYVAELTLPGSVQVAENAIVHGRLDLKTYPEPDLTLGILHADAVFSPVLGGDATRGTHALAFDTGIRCIRAPCPSLGVAKLNSDAPALNTGVIFSATSSQRRAALEAAFYEEFAKLSVLGQGAVVFGHERMFWSFRNRASYRRFVVTEVYTEKPGADPLCLVVTGELTATAWNVESLAAAESIIAEATGAVDLLTGRCGELVLPCTREYAPVHGIIDQLGEVCVDAGNECEFRAKIIHAAGSDSKAAGWWSPSLCYEPPPT